VLGNGHLNFEHACLKFLNTVKWGYVTILPIPLQCTHFWQLLVAWFSSNTLVLINVVTIRPAWLVLGWVTFCDR